MVKYYDPYMKTEIEVIVIYLLMKELKQLQRIYMVL